MKTYLHVEKSGARHIVVVGDQKGFSRAVAEREIIPAVRSYLGRIPGVHDKDAFVAVLLKNGRVMGAGVAFPIPKGFSLGRKVGYVTLKGDSYSVYGRTRSDGEPPEVSDFVIEKSGRLCLQPNAVGCSLCDLEHLFYRWNESFGPVAPESVFIRVGKSVLLQLPNPNVSEKKKISDLSKRPRIEERLLV